VFQVVVVAMLIVVSLVVLVLTLPGTRRGQAETEPDLIPPGELETYRERAEAILVARLLAGEFTPERYHREMAALALDDAWLHPLVIPRDLGR
jgi:uncharacterized membrane protein